MQGQVSLLMEKYSPLGSKTLGPSFSAIVSSSVDAIEASSSTITTFVRSVLGRFTARKRFLASREGFSSLREMPVRPQSARHRFPFLRRAFPAQVLHQMIWGQQGSETGFFNWCLGTSLLFGHVRSIMPWAGSAQGRIHMLHQQSAQPVLSTCSFKKCYQAR